MIHVSNSGCRELTRVKGREPAEGRRGMRSWCPGSQEEKAGPFLPEVPPELPRSCLSLNKHH